MTYQQIKAMMDGAREVIGSWQCKTSEDLVGYFIQDWFWGADDMPQNRKCVRVAENTAVKMFNKQ